MAANTLAPQIRFDDQAIRRFSTSGLSNRSKGSRGSGGERDPEEESDEEHPQDWTITTDEKDSWANRERRRSTVWSKTDNNTPLAPVQTEGRRGSVLSLWSPGKDKHGRPILKHNDEKHKDDELDESAISEGLSSPTGSRKGSLTPDSPFASRRGTGVRTGSKGQDRRPSILSMWGSGKDADGKMVMLHDDEEWNK